jgi:hypothetical protein
MEMEERYAPLAAERGHMYLILVNHEKQKKKKNLLATLDVTTLLHH